MPALDLEAVKVCCRIVEFARHRSVHRGAARASLLSIQNEFSDDDAFVTNALLCRRIRTARFDVRRMEDDNSWRLVASAVAPHGRSLRGECCLLAHRL